MVPKAGRLSAEIHLKALRQDCLLATRLPRQKFVPSCLPEPLKTEAPVHMDSRMAHEDFDSAA